MWIVCGKKFETNMKTITTKIYECQGNVWIDWWQYALSQERFSQQEWMTFISKLISYGAI